MTCMIRRRLGAADLDVAVGRWRRCAKNSLMIWRAFFGPIDVPVIRTVTTHSGRGFMVQARFAGDGSRYLRRQ
jgi:hypothetical protein